MSRSFEEHVAQKLQEMGSKIVERHPKGVDFLIEHENKRIAVEVKEDANIKPILPKALGQLLAAKTLHETSEEWLIFPPQKLYASPYFTAMKENNIRIFIAPETGLEEVKRFLSRKHDRKVRRGFDANKIGKIWKALADESDWLHIAEIARRSGINEVTVRWYLDHYLQQVTEEQRVAPSIKIRLVRLKPGVDFAGFIRALELIRSVKKKPA